MSCGLREWAAALWSGAVALCFMVFVLSLVSCATVPNVPPPAPEAVQVLVPIAKPCKVEKVEPSPLPSAGGVPADIFEAVKRVLADREVLVADRGKLVAANSDPCGEAK